MKGYLEEVGHITRLADPRDAWLPITASRSGNAYYAAFHSLSSGIGFQALVLPAAFASLGWYAHARTYSITIDAPIVYILDLFQTVCQMMIDVCPFD